MFKNLSLIKLIFLSLPIIIFSLFIISVWDNNFYVGGDLIFPLNPPNNFWKTFSIWDEENGGFSGFRYLLLFWELPFYLLSQLNIPPQIIIKIFIFSLYVCGFTFTILCYKTLFTKTKFDNLILAIISSFLFFLSASSLLVIPGAIPLYAFPICFYFILKYLENKNLFYVILFAFSVNISFFPDLNQGKLPAVFIASLLFLILIYHEIRKISYRIIFKRLFVLIIISIVLNSFALLPFIYDEFGGGGAFSYYTKNVVVYDGNADLHTAALPFISRFFCSNLIDKVSPMGKFLASPIFIIWSFLLWLISLLGLLFVKDQKDKKILYLLLIAVIFFIFWAKGPNPPFGNLYRYLLFNLPIFKFFRTTATIVIGGAIFYSFFTTLSAWHLFKAKYKILLAILVVHLIIFHPVYLGYKLLNISTGGIGKKGFTIPPSYYELGTTLDNLECNRKILSLPWDNAYSTKLWGYYGQSLMSWITKKPFIHYEIKGLEDLSVVTQKEACLATRLNNIGYTLWEKDSMGSSQVDMNQFGKETIIDNVYFQLNKTAESCFLPPIYIPEKTVRYVNDNTKMLSTANFYTSPAKVAYIMDSAQIKNTFGTDKFLNNYFSKSDLIINAKLKNEVKLINQNYKKENYGGEIAEVFYPYVRIPPDSLLYPLVEFKEKSDEDKYFPNKEKYYKTELLYASKRISEIEKWGVDNNWSDNLVGKYKTKMLNAIEAVKGDCDDCVKNLTEIYGQLNNHREKIENLALKNSWSLERRNRWVKELDQISKKLDSLYQVTDYQNLKYEVEIPETGNYSLILNQNANSITDYNSSWNINLDNHKLSTLTNVFKENTINGGKITLQKKSHEIEIETNPKNLINLGAWEKFEYSNIDYGNKGLFFKENSFIQEKTQGVYQPVIDWKSNSIYYLSVDYEGEQNASFGIVVAEDLDIPNIKNQIERKTFIIGKDSLKILSTGKGKYTAIFKSHKNSLDGKLYFVNLVGNSSIKDVKLYRIITPQVYISKINDSLDLSVSPTLLSIDKIKPTKYQLNLKGVNSPFFLVLSQAYAPGWTVYEESNNQPHISANYHLVVNGNMNGWLINPLEIKDKKETTLIIEYQPQRYFTIGKYISVISLLIIIFIKLFYDYRERRKTNVKI